MARRKSKGPKPHKFMNKLLLNQWLISLLGIDPLVEQRNNGKVVRPFHKLAEPIRDPRMEGLDADNIHKFYHNLINSDMFWNHGDRKLSKEQLLYYEENITRHTQSINECKKPIRAAIKKVRLILRFYAQHRLFMGGANDRRHCRRYDRLAL